MTSNKTHQFGKVIAFILGISTAFLVTGNSYGDAPSSPSLKVIKTKDIADDAKVESLWENTDPSDSKSRYNIGTIQKQQDGKQWLMVKGQKIFEGYTLSKATSASDGTIAVSSFSGLHNQLNGDAWDTVIDKKTGKNIQSISSVWLIDPSGAKHKITADDMNATYPIISQDGHWLAFLGESLDDKGFPKEPLKGRQLYVVSLQNDAASMPVRFQFPSRNSIMPIRWDKEDQLVVLTTTDENSSNYQLAWVQITLGN